MTSKPTRLHFAALLFFLFDALKGAVFPFVVAIMGVYSASTRIWTVAIIVAFLIFVIATTVLRYYMFTYQLLADEIVVKYGVFVKKVNHVPYDRIQNITTNQWFFLKPFNLEELEIETAGHSDKPEVELKAVPDDLRQRINDLREQVSSNETVESKPESVADELVEAESSTYMISWRDLIKFAFTSPAFLTGILVVLIGYGKVQKAISNQVYQNLADEMGHLGILVIIAIVFLILLVFYLGSALILIIQYYHFKLTEKDGHFIMERGLLQTQRTNISMDRIQAVMIKQPWLRSFLKIVTVQLVIISNSKKGDTEKDIIVMPVIGQNQVNAFLKKFFPDVPIAKVKQYRPNRWTYYYQLRNATIFALITTTIIVWLAHAIVWLCIVLVVLELIFWYLPAYFDIRRSKVQVLTDDFMAIQNNHLLTKQMFFIPKERIQITEKRTSLWLIKRKLASLTINVRSGINQKHIKVEYQSAEDIDTILNWYKK